MHAHQDQSSGALRRAFGNTPVGIGTVCLQAAQRAAVEAGGGVAIVVSESTGELVLAARHEAPSTVLELALEHVRDKGSGSFTWSRPFVSRPLPAHLFVHAESDIILTLASAEINMIDLFDAVFIDLAARRERYREQR